MSSAIHPGSNSDFKTGLNVRQFFRENSNSRTTTGLAPGYVQGNLVILREGAAAEFLRFCQRNPKPCPLIGVSEVGVPFIPELGIDLDVRTDLPAYRIWKEGRIVSEPTDIRDWWGNDLVAFIIGCSFSFEEALTSSGIPLRHVDKGVNVSMYQTNIACRSAGRFQGPMVVSMRPLAPANAIRAVQITSRFPSVHGAPIHIGHPKLIGINDLSRPEYGDAVEVRDNELPVFWACGVTPQAVIAEAQVDFAITHAPGSLLVTDLLNTDLAVY